MSIPHALHHLETIDAQLMTHFASASNLSQRFWLAMSADSQNDVLEEASQRAHATSYTGFKMIIPVSLLLTRRIWAFPGELIPSEIH